MTAQPICGVIKPYGQNVIIGRSRRGDKNRRLRLVVASVAGVVNLHRSCPRLKESVKLDHPIAGASEIERISDRRPRVARNASERNPGAVEFI